MLRVLNVEKTFNKGTINEKRALNGLNLELQDGDFVTVIGGNGAGKSTMLNVIAGVYPIDRGQIILHGENISTWPEHKRARFEGRVFQDPMKGTAANMQIQENLAMAYRRGLKRGLKWAITKEEHARYHEALKTLNLGLEDRMTAKVGTALRRAETGSDTAHGYPEKTGASAAGRAHGGAGPQDLSQSAGADPADCGGK